MENLDTSGVYKISAFTINNKGKYPLVRVLADKDGFVAMYFLKGYLKNVFISEFDKKDELKT